MNTALKNEHDHLNTTTPMNDDIRRIIEVANDLTTHGSTAGSTSEQIAAAFVLNDMQYLPGCYTNITDAWARLGHWQQHVHTINEHYRHLVRSKQER